MKLKTLPPTLRDKNRYIAFEIISDDEFTKDEVKSLIWEASLRVLGELGTALAKPWFIKYDPKTKTGIVRCDREYVEHLRFALMLATDFNGKRLIIRTLGVSGTIKRLKKKFLSQYGWK
ncbi:ribonuclease P protein component 2 [Pyrococcus abyssi]|uniref:Ribonuclease P protein component 2 n=1 Tax=Pyrococcus abyssi (strain GE5 / Orsay) TaxID=272844 RepID=RNP2_PYRAB|nr:ribonuclease P protein component 2 [Pyrococcus abyssi]Q9V0V4.2 RecName: Full=Ribonuclease P protein component 2; Short=RNase P component 2; AltName: Full=Pop5 [Pyrococcus abyssi GE5]CCE70075.1 TPA: ribonuclease P protein component 2 [Pyrococcus abyssi GE5]